MTQARRKHRMEALYGLLPVTLQNLAFTLHGYALRRQRYGAVFHDRLAGLRESEWWDSARLRDFQRRRVAELLAHAQQHVPYYRHLFQEVGLQAPDLAHPDALARIPILTKQTVRSRPGDFLDERAHVRRLRCNLTSGTTGKPLRVYYSGAELQAVWAASWRHRGRFGFTLGTPFVMFGARLPVPIEHQKLPVWRYNHAIGQAYLSSYHISPRFAPGIVDWLNRKKFPFFLGYPSALYSLATIMRDQGLQLTSPPKYVITASDALLDGMQQFIEGQFRAPVTERYGMAEGAGNISKCERGAFHVDEELSYLELEPLPGLQDDSGRQVFKMIFTGLVNFTMPFIRYDVGDFCTASPRTCPCGRQSRVIDRIDGRTEDFIRTPDGRLVMGMNQVFEWAEGVRETQIVQKRLDELEVRIVPDQGFDWSRDTGILRTELEKRLGSGMTLHFQQVEAIPRTEAGKFRAVVSQLPAATVEEQALRAAVRR